MKNKRNVLYSLAIMLIGVIYFPVRAQQKNGTHRADFSGEWKSKESIAMGGNIVCCYNSGDRMLAKTMKIAAQANFLAVEVSSSFPGAALVTSQEKLAFDGKQSKIDYGGGRGKEYAVKLSADGKTMTIKSIVYLMTPTPYHVNVQQQLIVNLTEVWKLSNDGKSITIQTNAKSNQFGDERSWKTVLKKSLNIQKLFLAYGRCFHRTTNLQNTLNAKKPQIFRLGALSFLESYQLLTYQSQGF